MKAFTNNIVYIDDSTKSMCRLIKKHGEVPIKPDTVCNDKRAYTNKGLGDLGEQYVKCLFNKVGITKLPTGQAPSPDFEISLNRKKFLLEAKTVSNLYKSPFEVLYEITKEESHNKLFLNKLKNISKTCDLNISPLEIRREDAKEFKENITKIIKELNLPPNKKEYNFKCRNKLYKISIMLKDEEFKGIYSILTGFLPDETHTLNNVIGKKAKQIGKSDILVVVLLNTDIDQEDLLDFFYRPLELILEPIPSPTKNAPFTTIMQYHYNQTIWGHKFKDEKGSYHTIDEQLKCVIVIYPSTEICLILPSIKHFENFTAPEYWQLKELLKVEGLKCYWVSHEIRLVLNRKEGVPPVV